MTGDEIDAALLPELTRYWECENRDLTIMESERIAYRAGMRRAAQIAWEREAALWHERRTSTLQGTYPEGLSVGAGDAADAIERAASDERKGGTE